MTDTLIPEPDLRTRLESDLLKAEAENSCGVEAATLRLVLCAVHDRDADARANEARPCCEDSMIRDMLQLMVRQREKSASRFEDAGRIDMADNERDEIEIIQRYLPAPMDDKTLNETVNSVIVDLEARSLKDLGRCMNEIKTRLPDADEARKAGKLVKKALCG